MQTNRLDLSLRLLCITHYAALLGANRSLLHLLEGLRAQYGVELLVFCPAHGPFTEALEQKGIPFKVEPFANWGYTIRSKRLYTFPWVWHRAKQKAVPALEIAARDFNPDYIHSNSSLVALGAYLAKRLNKQHIWHLREFGWEDYGVVYPFGSAHLSQKLADASALVFISEAIRQHWSAKLAQHGCPPPKSQVIFNGIGPEKKLAQHWALSQAQAQRETDDFLIIGQLQATKGQHEAIEAFSAIARDYPKARLIVAGAGQKWYTLRLKWLVWRLGLRHRVLFTGYVEQPAPWYANAKAVLMCSRHEGMGRVTAEAMSYGKPVVGFKGGATPELIRHGENGFLYQTKTELTQYMRQLLDDPALCATIGQQAHTYACMTFSDEAYVKNFQSLILNY